MSKIGIKYQLIKPVKIILLKDIIVNGNLIC